MRVRIAAAVVVITAMRCRASADFMECDFSTAVWAVRARPVDSRWQLVEGLQSTDFVVTANGMPQKLCGFTTLKYPASIGMLLDASGSMRDANPELEPGLEQILRLSGPQDEYFLAYANDGAALAVPFTGDIRLVRNGFSIAPKGRTRIFDGLFLSLTQMKAAQYPTRALIVLSDGRDNRSVKSEEDLKKAFLASPVPIFLIMPPRYVARSRPSAIENDQRKDLIRFVEQSGGYTLEMYQMKDFQAVASGIAIAIRTPYVLFFQSAQLQTKPTNVRVTLKGVHPRQHLFYETVSQERQ
jgi:Ca-activated chloride channel family protein